MKPRIIILVAIIFLIAILSFYVHTFSGGISSNHMRRSEFGSFFGGVVGASFAFLSLIYLAIQVEMQWKENRASRLDASLTNREQNVSNLLMIMIPKLKELDPAVGAPLAEMIIRIHKDHKNRTNKDFMDVLEIGLSARSETLAVWVNVSAALSYLKSLDEQRYLNQITLVAVQLGWGLCKALDDVVHLATKIGFEQHFNINN